MKKTRNAVTEIIKNRLSNKLNTIEERDNGDHIIDIYVNTESDEICLGYREIDSLKITPKCPALMAQHYFNLYKFITDKRPKLKELWIFDFNRYTERESVKMGANVSFILHQWPRNFSLKIVNCVYSKDGKGSIQVIEQSN